MVVLSIVVIALFVVVTIILLHKFHVTIDDIRDKGYEAVENSSREAKIKSVEEPNEDYHGRVVSHLI